MKNIFTDFALKQVVLFVTISVILIQTFVGMLWRYECKCATRGRDCSMHISIPFLIIFVLQLWADETLRYTFARIESCFRVVYHMIKATLVGLLWVAFVLINGDWYACCVNNERCDPYRTYEQDYSRVIGLSLLLAIVDVAALMSSVGWKKCCEDSGSNTNNLYQKVRLDEEENVLKRIAEEKLKAQLEQRWEEEAAAREQIALRPTGNQVNKLNI
ncbi:hypothetical protein EPR50_G00082060 [Perca flavescens]|uniref:Uncharacterized protein n=1 Tax=Perca flavescens TaxID=8167 RepID=A0A484D6W2_PERFV|nr:hypothetical protein EPR50_G00082060 [Perca flavescens]